ncbi:MAG: maleamate amidohydrolase [Chloroflexota bacterium]|jgi:nicotinamidase-related amidase|nr:maleamate amidohydrolase [Chloroflexota bacterium]
MRKVLSIEPGKAGALFVDLQEEHRRDSRHLVDRFDMVIANVRRLQQAARAAGIPVVHSAYIVDLAVGRTKPFHPVLPDGRSAFSDIADPWTAICPEVAPVEGETLLVKSDASSFADGVAAGLLGGLGVEWLFVSGVWSEACLAATVRDAVELGFRTILVKDACGSGSQAMHETAILNLANRLHGGAVTDTEGASRLMAGEAVDVWVVDGSVPLRFTYEDAADLYERL